jgi:hypothetical protein
MVRGFVEHIAHVLGIFRRQRTGESVFTGRHGARIAGKGVSFILASRGCVANQIGADVLIK